MRQSLGAAFNPRSNSLNFLRLFFALAVIVSHSWPLSGLGNDPELGDQNLGKWAVAGFFVISGYLITSSRMGDPSTTRFLLRRVLRIYPGYWVALLVVAVIAGPIGWAHYGHPGGSYWTAPDGPVRYVASNLTLWRSQGDIAGGLAHAPFPGDWNGSLWSLPFEFVCYLIVGGIGAFAIFRGKRWPLATATAAFFVLTLANHTVLPTENNYYISRFLDYGLYFFCGALIWAFRDRIPAGWWAAGLAAAWLVITAATGTSIVLGGLPLAYLCIWLGYRLPLQAIGRRYDISYGVYLYAFPVQQLLAAAGVQRWGIAAYLLLSIAATLPLAWLSYAFVERPALRLKNRQRGGRRAQLAPVEGDPVR